MCPDAANGGAKCFIRSSPNAAQSTFYYYICAEFALNRTIYCELTDPEPKLYEEWTGFG